MSGEISPAEGLRDFFENLITSAEVRRGILNVESSELTGELAIFCSRYITGARLEESSVVGFEAARQLLSLRNGEFAFRNADDDEMAHLKTSVAIDIISLIDWADPESVEPPPLERALDEIVGHYAQTIMPETGTARNGSGDNADGSVDSGATFSTGPASDFAPIGSASSESTGSVSTGPADPESSASTDPVSPEWTDPALDSSSTDPDVSSQSEVDRENKTSMGYSIHTMVDPEDLALFDNHNRSRDSKLYDLKPTSSFDSQELDSIPAPHVDSEDGVDLWTKKRQDKQISDNEKREVGKIYRDSQRITSPMEFVKVPKRTGEEHVTFKHKDVYGLSPILQIVFIVGICCLSVVGIYAVNQVIMRGHSNDLLSQGIEHLQNDDKLAALTEFDSAVRNNPDDAGAYVDRGMAYLALGQEDNALSDYKKAKQLDSKNTKAYVGCAKVMLRRDDYTSAIATLDECLKIDSRCADAYAYRAVAHAAKGEYNEAIRDANKAIIANPLAPPETYEARALAEWHSNQYEAAVRDYSQAMDTKPADSNGLLGRGSCYLAMGEYDRAIGDLSQCLRLDPTSAAARIARAKAYAHKNDNNNAIADLDKAVELEPHSAEVYAARGHIYMESKEYGPAISDFEKALDIKPDWPEVQSERDTAYARVKQLKPIVAGDRPETDTQSDAPKKHAASGAGEQDVATLTEIVRSNPNDTKSRRYLAYALMREGSSGLAASQFQALEAAGVLSAQDELVFADTLVAGGNYERAVSVYKRLLDSNPGNTAARARLIDLYLRLGRRFEADALSARR
jgi:tetratricopeptide (TPR) repeat protein